MSFDDSQGIPSWDGNPTTFGMWKKKLNMWKHSIELGKRKSWAAVVATRLTGDAQEACLLLKDDDWEPWGEIRDRDEAAYEKMNKAALKRLEDHLEAHLLQKKPVQKAEKMAEFFKTNKWRRHRGVSMNNFFMAVGEAILHNLV